MLSLIFRIIGYLFLLGAIIALIADIVGLVSTGSLAMTPLGQTWFTLHPGSLNLTQAIVQRFLHPAIWDPGIQWVLLRPTWLVLIVVAIVFIGLAGLTRRRTA